MLFHEYLRASAEKSGFDRDKNLVNELDTRLVPHESIKIGTVKTHVSKLLSGVPQGREFFLDPKHPHRLSVLCEVLGVEVEHVQCLGDQAVLVLDPRIPDEAVEFLRDRQATAASPFEVVLPPTADDPRAAARDCARDHRNALVVMVAEGDGEYFNGASVNATLLERVPRGWLILEHESLYELPPPPPPVLFDADGKVRVPVVGSPWLSWLRDAVGHYQDSEIREAIADGLSPTISLGQAVDWLRSIPWKREPRVHNGGHQDHHAVFVSHPDLSAFPGFPSATRVWEYQGRVYATGEDAARFSELLSPHHPVLTPTWPEDIEAVLPIFDDPWTAHAAISDESDPAVAAILVNIATVGEFGLVKHTRGLGGDDVVGARAFVKDWLVGKAKWTIDALSSESRVPEAMREAAGPARVPSAVEATSLRARLQALLDHGAEPNTRGFALLRVLQLGLTNPLIVLDHGDNEPHLFIDLGRGKHAEVRTVRLKGTNRPLKFVRDFDASVRSWPPVWGGDVLVKVITGEASILSGVVAAGSGTA